MLRALLLLAACVAVASGARSSDRLRGAADDDADSLAPQTSPLFAEAGELWRPDGPLPDFSFAGYRFGDAELPSPPATKRLADFQGPGVSDSEALQAAVDWANAQPESAGWVVLGLPAGQLTVDRQLNISRPQTVLRGEGAAATTLRLTRSLTDLKGPSNYSEGYWVYSGGLLTLAPPGNAPVMKELLAAVNASTPVPRGSYSLQVSSWGAPALRAGDIVTLVMHGGNGTLGDEIMNHKLDAGPLNANYTARYTSRIASVSGNTVALERPLPWTLRKEMVPALVRRKAPVYDVGLEGFTLQFPYTPYLGHHKELGLNAIHLVATQDCWVRDVGIVNADNGILIEESDRITIANVTLDVTAPRNGPPEGSLGIRLQGDGHWGVRVARSCDVLGTGLHVKAQMVHSLGADDHGMFSVFEACRLERNGSLEMHRALSTQLLFTDISIEDPCKSVRNGGPAAYGPNAGAYTTYWNVRSDTGSHPPPDHNGTPGYAPRDCTFGADLNFIGVAFNPPDELCPTYVHQQAPVVPANLYRAQRARRQRMQAKSLPAGGSTQGPWSRLMQALKRAAFSWHA
ncbi:band 7 [Chlorella sorokiniana]|uniref:Band 7 n=1 Tax=Chlorella sorokiniana TaxID=3076 RepID=A0A2P6TH65_CHLSO|nr:band 7 [Chlorella sorokiniana]|eukprot:PRW33624.1 band 7 [Chlorella sorokiniana]